MGTVVGVDLGGTNVLAAAVSSDGEATDHIKETTPTGGPDEVIELLVEMVTSIDDSPAAVGVGFPGPVSQGVVIEAPNLAGWTEPVKLAKRMAKRLKAPVTLGNDANVGTLGEARHGAGAGAVNALGCWMGTGIGGGLIIDGRLFEGQSGTAGELGHVPVEMTSPRRCGCGRWGCVEAYAGRASMRAMVDRLIAEGGSSEMVEIMEDKGKTRFTSSVWKKALKNGDEVATAIMDEAVIALGIALAGMINTLDLDTLIFGGGLAEKLGQDHVDRIEEVTLPRLMAPDVKRRWVVASLGDDSGVVGAAELARAAEQAV
ncbi:ROK family protein [Euzebya tangerina]|uniref:ROK family protein n=1 Tax=Euzebya tangerina TaxID=591198 RepID=UPI000E31C698|nr:ROK family protein [Euzebya tangerina]